ncbi:hypothetical protein AXE80_09355 [Wenyingzhuangia fucanilytica]|uniref:PKD domain-containing protein n=2 Tax=Wenyingzhuangia fucanilytica TaxID=1790137 RepID=A0A1B1Y6T2_9FLAO|nr:hypothetical protein AXE80_09355 [Wenyingzhuangia fucanilytica]
MKLLKKGKYVLLALSIIACSKDEDVAGSSSASITNLTFTSVSVDDTGKVVGVTPTSTGGTNTVYTVDFGDANAIGDADIKQTSGPQVTYEYQATTATYDIKVTAVADNADEVSVTKQHTVTFEAGVSLADFEDEASLNLRDDRDNDGVTIEVETKNGKDGTPSKVGVVTSKGDLYEAFIVNRSKHVDVTSKSIITMDFYQETAAEIPVLMKLGGASIDGGFDIEVLATTTATSGWQTLSFDFSKDATNSFPNHETTTITLDQFQSLIVFIGFAETTTGTFYVDNITGGGLGLDVPDTDNDGVIDSIDKCVNTPGTVANGGCPEETDPVDAPTAPTKSAADVISLYSDAYTDVSVDTWKTDWSVSNYEEKTIASNPVKLYTSLSYAGVETTSATIDASTMTHVHIDIWSSNATEFGLKIVDFGADGAFDGGDDTEGAKTITGFANGSWVSFDFPLSDFPGLVNKGHLAQYIITALPNGEASVFIDNFYFYK